MLPERLCRVARMVALPGALALGASLTPACSEGVPFAGGSWWERHRTEARQRLLVSGASLTSLGPQRSAWTQEESWELELPVDWPTYVAQVTERFGPSFRQVRLDEEHLLLVQEFDGDVLQLQLVRLSGDGGELRVRASFSGAAR